MILRTEIARKPRKGYKSTKKRDDLLDYTSYAINLGGFASGFFLGYAHKTGMDVREGLDFALIYASVVSGAGFNGFKPRKNIDEILNRELDGKLKDISKGGYFAALSMMGGYFAGYSSGYLIDNL